MDMLEVIHTFLNIAAPPFTFFSLLLLLPPFHIFKLCTSLIATTLFCEDVAHKVVIVTGASSGIGECVAYEYAKRRACLVLAARREKCLEEVADRARDLGSPDVIVVCADVSKPEDCLLIVDQAMNHFGRLDHLVNNAGIASMAMLEEVKDVTVFKTVMDINFWGSVYMTRFAAPYLRENRGRIVVLSSSAAWLPEPRMSIYSATKAALLQFFETMRVEFCPDIGITIVTPGLIESELTQGKFLNKDGKIEVDTDMRDVKVSLIPIQRTDICAKAIVRSAIRGDRYLTEPAWFRMTYIWKIFFTEVVEWVYRVMYMVRLGDHSPREATGKKILDYTRGKGVHYPDTLQASEPKRD